MKPIIKTLLIYANTKNIDANVVFRTMRVIAKENENLKISLEIVSATDTCIQITTTTNHPINLITLTEVEEYSDLLLSHRAKIDEYSTRLDDDGSVIFAILTSPIDENET